MQDAARKGREPADRSGKGRRRRGPLKSQREKRCFFFLNTLYVFSILNFHGVKETQVKLV